MTPDPDGVMPLSAEEEAEMRERIAERKHWPLRFDRLLATLDKARDEWENGPSGPALIPYGEPCPICGPEGHALHQDDSYGSCITCRTFTPHTDRDTDLVPYPCLPALVRDGVYARAPHDAPALDRERWRRLSDVAEQVIRAGHEPTGNDPIASAESWHLGFGAGVASMQQAVAALGDARLPETDRAFAAWLDSEAVADIIGPLESGEVTLLTRSFRAALSVPATGPEGLLLPGHRCRKVAEAHPLETGRELWLGELTEPYPGFEQETHCLHVTTPQKSVVFGVYRGDFDLLSVFGYIVAGGKPITERWLSRMAEAFRSRAALSADATEGTG